MGMADIGQNRLHYAIARCLPELVAPRHCPVLARAGRTAPRYGHMDRTVAALCTCRKNPPPLYLCLRSYPSAKPGAVPARLPPDAAFGGHDMDVMTRAGRRPGRHA